MRRRTPRQPVVVVQVAEAIQPEIAEDHREKIEAGEITETEAGKNKKQRDKGKCRYCENCNGQLGRIKKDVIHGRVEGVRKPEIGKLDEG